MNELIKKYNLPAYIKGKSFSEASKIIQSKFKGREDKVSKDTLNILLGRLRDAQEFNKQQNDPQPELSPSQNAQPQTQDVQQFAGGGPMFTIQGGQQSLNGFTEQNPGMKSAISGQFGEGTPGPGAYLGAATAAIDFGKQIFNKPNIDIMGNGNEQTQSGTGTALNGVMKGAQAGMAFGPWGAAIGGVVGGVSGFIGGQKRNDAIEESQQNKSSRVYNTNIGNFAKGGYMNKYGDGSPFMNSKLGGIAPLDFSNLLNTGYDKNGASLYNVDTNNDYFSSKLQGLGKNLRIPRGINPTVNNTPTQLGGIDTTVNTNKNNSAPEYKKKSGFGSTVNAGKSALRYAPIAMNAYQLAKLKKPEVERLNKLDNRYQEQYVDERRLMNSINEGYGLGSALQGSGGSLARFSTLSRANQLNKTKATSDAYQRAADTNRNENRIGQNFNKATDTFNIGQNNRERDINARNRAAYDNNKSKLLSQIGTDVGVIGKEYLQKEQVGEITGYDWKGKYLKQNPNANTAQAEKAYKLYLKNNKKK